MKQTDKLAFKSNAMHLYMHDVSWYTELSMLQRLEAKSLFSACIAECWNCIRFLLSGPDDEVRHNSLESFLEIGQFYFNCVI